MPIKHLRIDNRLVHGQVTVAWVGYVGVDHIIVANDEVANDELQRLLLPQAARGVRTSVVSVADAIKHCLSPETAGENIMILAKWCADALELVEGGVRPEVINVGNQAPKPGTKFTMVTRSISVTPEDAVAYRKMAEIVGGLTSQMMPKDKPADFLKLMEKKKI
ncbi:MAG TPA: PTS sugar transporter subunit IIB [Pseudonocardiaceae bacterium]|jgi:PTS system mannose-specific IIB component|nr:PTS sugar transporter subunit IIB [Pseudonocardiaceae bacterium]